MRERLQAHLDRTGLLPAGARLLVAYSGGADSTALLTLLAELGYDLVAAHLHHGQRSEADREARLCEAYATELDVPFLLGRADVPRLARDRGTGLEEAGRDARYEFLRRAAFRTEAAVICTGHTADDQIETVFFRIARGTGLDGLAGIPAWRDGIARPMLPFGRDETRAFCDGRGLWYHDDPANSDLSFARARVRHRVVPEMQAVHPGFREGVLRLADQAEEETRFLDGMAAAALERVEVPLNGPLRFLTAEAEVAFDRSGLESLPPVLFRRALRLATRALGGELGRDAVEAFVASVQAPFGSVSSQDGAVLVTRTPERYHFSRQEPDEQFRHNLTYPGETVADLFGWTLVAEPVTATGTSLRASLEVEIPTRVLRPPLHFRSAAPGDRMRPLGFDGHRRLSDLLGESGLTPAARRRLPLIADVVGLLWAPGVCLDERARAEPNEPALRLRLAPNVPYPEGHNGGTGLSPRT